MFRQGSLIAVVLALFVVSDDARAATKLDSRVRTLGTQLTKQKSALGKAETARLDKYLRNASTSLRRKRTCSAVTALGRYVERTRKLTGAKAGPAGLKLSASARRKQMSLGRKARCGKVTLKTSKAVKPLVAALPPVTTGPARPVTAIKGKRATTSFTENELLVSTKSDAQLKGLLKRTGGKVVTSSSVELGAHPYSAVHLVRLPAKARTKAATMRKRLASDLKRLDPRARGSLTFNDSAAMRTLAVAAQERARGLHVGINPVLTSHAAPLTGDELAAFPGQKFLDGATSDGDGWNAFTDENFKEGGLHDWGVVSAWRDLESIGRLTPGSVEVAVIDSGFIDTKELPGSSYNTTKLGKESGKENHGYFVSQVLAGMPDNGLGTAGVGGPVAKVRGIYYDVDGISLMARVYDAIDSGQRIINMSLGSELDAAISWANIPLEDATQSAAEKNRLVIVSAGNAGVDVDAEDCFFACWEEEVWTPCENDGVLCVGGTFEGTAQVGRDFDSNYGFESCGSFDCSVKIFAPYNVRTLGTDGKTLRSGSGTSYSAPYVSGAAALMLAVNPSISAKNLRKGLLDTANTYLEQYGIERVINRDPEDDLARWVDVEAAVRSVAITAAPRPGIVPVADGPYSFGVKRRLRGLVVSRSGVDPATCCTYRWRSDKDGNLGTGREIDATFGGGSGTRTITLRVESPFGTAETSTKLTLTGNQPVPKITTPANGATLYKGIEYKLEGSWTDPDIGFTTGDCSALKWTIDRGFGDPTILTGCEPAITFGVNGQKTVKLEATDSDGNVAAVMHTITVTDAPLNQPPIVQILTPSNNQLLEPASFYSLKGSAVDPDGGPMTYQWTIQNVMGGGETVIATANPALWRPLDDIPSSCGGRDIFLRFKATDANGTTVSTPTRHHINYGAC